MSCLPHLSPHRVLPDFVFAPTDQAVEINSAHPHGTGDFVSHRRVDYATNSLVLVETRGRAGCMVRLFTSGLTYAGGLGTLAPDVRSAQLRIRADGVLYSLPFQGWAEYDSMGGLLPAPLAGAPRPGAGNMAGRASYLPVCFAKTLVVALHLDPSTSPLPGNLTADQFWCTSNFLPCPLNLYWSASLRLFPRQQPECFGGWPTAWMAEPDVARPQAEALALAARAPSKEGVFGYRANDGRDFSVPVAGREWLLVTAVRGPGAVTKWEVQVARPLDWNRIEVAWAFDGADPDAAQVRTPLGHLFGSTRRGDIPSMSGLGVGLSRDTGMGHFYFPMPFEREAQLWVRRIGPEPEATLVLKTRVMWDTRFPASAAGHLHARHVGGQVPRLEAIKIGDFAGTRWGSIVGVMLAMESSDPDRDVSLEGDLAVFADERRAASLWTTGNEDFFNVARNYRFASNFAGPLFGNPIRKELQAFSSYRLLVAGDAITFRRGAEMWLQCCEANQRQNWASHCVVDAVVLAYVGRTSGMEAAPVVVQARPAPEASWAVGSHARFHGQAELERVRGLDSLTRIEMWRGGLPDRTPVVVTLRVAAYGCHDLLLRRVGWGRDRRACYRQRARVRILGAVVEWFVDDGAPLFEADVLVPVGSRERSGDEYVVEITPVLDSDEDCWTHAPDLWQAYCVPSWAGPVVGGARTAGGREEL